MDFGSIRRKNRVSQPSRRKTFSASNLSCISCNSASVSKKSVYVTLPRDSGCEVNLDGKIVHLRRSGPAHAVGVLQIGDYLRIIDDHDDNDEIVKLQVTFGVLQVEMRPDCPLVIEIGNRSHTSLGIALADSSDNKIQISSIQPGSLADRCGYIQPGDILSSVHTSANEAIPCNYYNSYQVAQILRQLTGKNSSVKLTIVPSSSDDFFLRQRNSTEDIDMHSGGSDSTLTLVDDSPNYAGGNQQNQPISCFSGGGLKSGTLHKRQISKVDEIDEENGYVMSMCLWKDPLYEDWGFSLVDQSEDTETEDESDEKKLMEKNATNKSNGAVVYQIRPGGPAFVAGLRSSDRIIEINGRDVSELESTMLVPILASLEDALNICILRMPTNMDQ